MIRAHPTRESPFHDAQKRPKIIAHILTYIETKVKQRFFPFPAQTSQKNDTKYSFFYTISSFFTHFFHAFSVGNLNLPIPLAQANFFGHFLSFFTFLSLYSQSFSPSSNLFLLLQKV